MRFMLQLMGEVQIEDAEEYDPGAFWDRGRYLVQEALFIRKRSRNR